MKKLGDLTDSEFRDWIADRLKELLGFTDNEIDAIEKLYYYARNEQAYTDGEFCTDDYTADAPLSGFWQCLFGTYANFEYAEEYLEIMGEEMEDD